MDSEFQGYSFEEQLEKTKFMRKPINWKEKFPQLGDDGIDLISRMLEIDPEKRISARDALDHIFLQ